VVFLGLSSFLFIFLKSKKYLQKTWFEETMSNLKMEYGPLYMVELEFEGARSLEESVTFLLSSFLLCFILLIKSLNSVKVKSSKL
jgi:hypothetical protein